MGTTSYSSSSSSLLGNLSLKIRAKLCKTAQATTIFVEHSNFVESPLDKRGNLRFQVPNVLSTIPLVPSVNIVIAGKYIFSLMNLKICISEVLPIM